MPGTFSPPSRVSDPDMHHGTCVMHVPWCMSGSLTSDFRWGRWRVKRSRHSRRMRNTRFYLETNGMWVPSPLSNSIGVLLRVVFFMPAIPVTPGYIKPKPHRHYYVKFMKHPWSLRNTAWFNMYAPMIVFSALSDQIHVVHTHQGSDIICGSLVRKIYWKHFLRCLGVLYMDVLAKQDTGLFSDYIDNQ